MKKATAMVSVMAAMLVLVASVFAGSIHYGPISFTNAVPFSYPQFPPATGYLHSVTFVVTNCVLDKDIIVDNDSSNSVILDVTAGQPFHLVRAGSFWLGGSRALVFSISDNLNGTFEGTNDGDARFIRDGGDDELLFHVSHTNISRETLVTSGRVLAMETGSGVSEVIIGNFLNSLIGPPTPIGEEAAPLDVFHTNTMCTGELYVEYKYASTPLEPDIVGLAISNATITLDIQNISVASSNRVQRCFDLRSNDWVDVETFVSGDWKADWTEQISNVWNGASYRVLSQ